MTNSRSFVLTMLLALIALSPLLMTSASAPAGSAAKAPPAPPGWKLVWSDDFDGDKLESARWEYDRGNDLVAGNNQRLRGWGNNELEFYTSRPQNVFVSDGTLHIRAIREQFNGCQYTSGRIKTKGLFSKKYGRFEFCAKLPTGKGIWPAIWFLPEDEHYGAWPASGEIDLMEARGQEPEKVLGTLHYGSHWPGNAHSGEDYVFPNHGTIGDFHVYTLEWEPGEIRFFVDDHLYQKHNFWWSSGGNGRRGGRPAGEADMNPWPAPFDRPFYIIINLAVGGQFLGNPDATTPFPATMEVKYVRVYDAIDGYPAAKPRGEGQLPFARK